MSRDLSETKQIFVLFIYFITIIIINVANIVLLIIFVETVIHFIHIFLNILNVIYYIQMYHRLKKNVGQKHQVKATHKISKCVWLIICLIGTFPFDCVCFLSVPGVSLTKHLSCHYISPECQKQKHPKKSNQRAGGNWETKYSLIWGLFPQFKYFL